MAAAGIVGSGVETPWTGKGAALEPDQTTALAPGIPQNLSLLRQTSGILLAWDPVPNAGSYNIYRSQDPQSLDWGLPVANTVTPSWVDSSGGDGYFYRVTALSE